jgi:hypothetical protein
VSRFAGRIGLSDVVREFEPAFRCVVDLKDCRLPVLLSLFPGRILLHLDDFLASRTSTMHDFALLEALRTIAAAEFAAIVGRPGVLPAATAALGETKTSGHVTDFLRTLHDRRALALALQTAEWAEYAEGTLLPHLRRVGAAYGGPHAPAAPRAMRLSPSAELMPADPPPEGSSSSGSASDDEPACIPRSASGPCSILRAKFAPAVPLLSDFDYVAGMPVARSDTQINQSQVPGFRGAPVPAERRARRRNAGSVTLADLPKGPVT